MGKVPGLFTTEGNFRWNMGIKIADSQGSLAEDSYGCGLAEELDDGYTFTMSLTADRESYGEIRVTSLLFDVYVAERYCY